MPSVSVKAEPAQRGGIVTGSHGRSGARSGGAERGWKAVGWFGALLAVIGLSDVALYWYPFAFASEEWQFATVAAAFSALPLATIGLAAVVGALLVVQARNTMIVTASFLLVLALLVAASYWMFMTNLPMALQAAEGAQGPAIHRGIVRTTIKGVGFGSAYLVAAIMMFRHLPPRNHA